MVDHLHRQWKALVYTIETPVYFFLVCLILPNRNSLKFSKGTNTASFSVGYKHHHNSCQIEQFATREHCDCHYLAYYCRLYKVDLLLLLCTSVLSKITHFL